MSSSMVFSNRDIMLKAISLARKCKGEEGKISPLVGAVVTRDGAIIGEAYRGEIVPGEHAEYTLFERKLPEETLAGATLFTTLEPCTSRNSPKIPCAERAIVRRIKKVVIGTLDPNPQIRGNGELRLRESGIQVERFDSDLMSVLEEMNRDFFRQYRSSLKDRSANQTIDPVETDQIGPNGHKIGYTEAGDKVEWIPDEESPDVHWPLILRRNDRAIIEAYEEFWDKVWWNRHQVLIQQTSSEDQSVSEEQKLILERAKGAARKIEDKYGREDLELDDFEWGLLNGKMSALSWVMGAEWNESLDT